MDDEVSELHVILVAQCSVDPVCLLMLLFSLPLANQEQEEHSAARLVLEAWWVSNF